jgi:hypothetical protein
MGDVHWPASQPGNAAEQENLRRVSRDIAIAICLLVFSCGCIQPCRN